MKLAILSREPDNYSTKVLKQAAQKRGHEVTIMDPTKFALDIDSKHPLLYYKQQKIKKFDAVLPRIGNSITYFGCAVVRQFQKMDIYTANNSNAIINSRDKLRSFQLLSKHNIGLPKTTFVRDRKDVVPAIKRVGGVPVVIKLLEGTQGIGVLLANTLESATSIIELLHSQKNNVLIQKFVSESKGKDIRAIVVGDKVVAAMRRVAQGEEFRSNIHRGGKTQVVKLSSEYQEAAVRASRVLGLHVAGVDMLEGKDGPQIMEVNSSPGLEGIETCTKIDVAGAIIDYIATNVDFQEVDLQQKLSVTKGYGLTEVQIGQDSKYVGQSLDSCNFGERDINILTLNRGGKSYPNPKSDHLLKSNDRLICFGKIDSLKAFIPGARNLKKLPSTQNLRI